MKYENEIMIDQPIDKVIFLLEDSSKFSKWMPGFISMEPISGAPGQEGSIARWKLKSGGAKVEMIETITKRDLPDELHFHYTAKGMIYTQQNHFTITGINGTKWTLASEYHFKGILKLFAWLMPGVFRKQTQKFLERFKEFAEKELR